MINLLQTGTLTENRMTVVEGWFAGISYQGRVPDMLDLPEAVRPHLELNIAMNSKVPALHSVKVYRTIH